MKNICVLGSTGSIGTQTLEVVRMHSDKFCIKSLAVYSNIELLENQIREFKPQAVAVFDLKKANELKNNIKDLDVSVLAGMDGLVELATMSEVDIVLNSVIGMIGLTPTLKAIEAKKDIALANKETLVAGGEIVMRKVKEHGVKILPVDSEHSAIFQCLQGLNEEKELKRIILTASGGPFFGKTYEELKNITPAQALKHPNWEMGAKITIDSATMMNKGLEIIEAKWLFDLKPEQIDVVVHRESVIHSLTEFTDNSTLAQLGVPDMIIPIQYALTYPSRLPSKVKQLNLWEYGNLSFYKPNYEVFKCLRLAVDALNMGGVYMASLNAADEEAVRLFLENKIGFTDIADLCEAAMKNQTDVKNPNLADVFSADKLARQFVKDNFRRI